MAEEADEDHPDAHSQVDEVTYQFSSVWRSNRDMGGFWLKAPAGCRCTVLEECVAKFFSQSPRQITYPLQVHIWLRGARLMGDTAVPEEVLEAVIIEESVEDKEQSLLDRTACPELREKFRRVIEEFRDAPHERAGQADRSGQFSRFLDFLEDYRHDSVQFKGPCDVDMQDLLDNFLAT
ncbi:unnamed protein product [Cladocopium goreaui]|uniref:Uncharacterized protein n=1 Tax=Cladocopium goreaui TaxID=2562237 RepID=A0A9P1BXJ1_9DINO|nr:unnamed protein product [Cladocopium goreaui]